MSMRSMSLLLLGMTLMLSGCPSAFYAKTQFSPQSAEEIAAIANPATVKIERDNNVWGGAIPLVVYDGGKEIGRLGPEGAFEWKRQAGYLHLRISETTGRVGAIVGQGHPDDIYHEDYVEPGEIRAYMCGIVVDDKVSTWIKGQQQQAPEDIIAFGRARQADTVEAYGQFLLAHPESSRAGEVMERYESLIEEVAILSIDKLDKKNVGILQTYLDAAPNGKHRQFAKEVDQYYRAERKPSAKAFEDYLQQWPDGRFEKWAKENLAFVSSDPANDRPIAEALAKANEALLGEFTELQDKAEENTSRSLIKVQSFTRYTRMKSIRGSMIILDGTFVMDLRRQHLNLRAESYHYNGDATVDDLKFSLKAGVSPSPKWHKDTGIISGFTEGSSAVVDGKEYYYDGTNWAPGLSNPFFSTEARTAEQLSRP